MEGITRRKFLKASLAGAISASFFAENGCKPKDHPMNLLYIMTDQQPISTLGCYGNPLNPTPNLDRLAETGMKFTNFYISAFPCSPSRATMFTGLYPHKHGVTTNNVMLSENIPSLGFLLQNSGWDTAYFGKSHLKGHMYRNESWREPYNGSWYNQRIPDESDFRFEQIEGGLGEDHAQLGFQTWAGGWKDYHGYLEESGLGHLLEERSKPGNHNDLPNVREGNHMYSRLPEEHHMAAFFTDKAVEYIRSRKNNPRPFGAVLSYFGPHLPVAPPRPWDEKYSLEQCLLPSNYHDTLEGKPLAQKNNKVCYKHPEWEDHQFKDYIRRYYGYCAYLDGLIGKVLKALDEAGLADNTMVIFTSDHGDMVAGHGFVYKMEACGYQELAQVPFLIRVPHIGQPGSTTDSLAGSVDILPTLLETLGLPEQKNLQGKSMLDCLKGEGQTFRDTVFIHWGGKSFISFDGEWKYCFHRYAEVDELYNLFEDPGELKNLMGDSKYTDIAARKRQEIFDWLHETGHPYIDVMELEKKL